MVDAIEVLEITAVDEADDRVVLFDEKAALEMEVVVAFTGVAGVELATDVVEPVAVDDVERLVVEAEDEAELDAVEVTFADVDEVVAAAEEVGAAVLALDEGETAAIKA